MLDGPARSDLDAPGGRPFTGGRVGDISGTAKTRGATRYVGDLSFDAMLEAAVVRSPLPHAEIVSIDLSAALGVPGVVAAVTSDDFAAVTYIGFGGSLSDRPPLARGVVRYVGEEVAGIAATSADALARALPLVRVRYRRKRAVFDAEAALAAKAPHLHQTSEAGNIVRCSVLRRGDPEARPALGGHSVRAHYETGSQAHCCLETHTVVASWPEEEGPLDLWCPTQGPLSIRRELAHVFAIPEQRIRLHDVGIGGDFGSRVKICTSEAIAVALARKTRQPVRLRLSREEEFAATKRRCPFTVDIELHAGDDGIFTRLTAEIVSEMGAYHAAGAGDFGYFPQALSSLYAIGAVSISAIGVYTNQNPPGSFRGAGAPQAAFVRESAIDELAAKMRIDPFDLRLRNLERSDAPGAGWSLDNRQMKACLERARQEIGWGPARSVDGKRRGFGVAASVHVTGIGVLKAEAYVDLDAAGGITVRSSSADPGTGQRTVLAQIAAHELGVDPARIEVVLGEPQTSPYDPGLGASKGSYVSTNAVGAAARDLAEKLVSAAIARFEVNDVALADGFVRTSAGSLSLAELVPLCPETEAGVLRGQGGFAGGRSLDDPDPSDGYAYAAQAVEVEVDEALGLVRIVKLVSIHDSGTILNPILARGQVEGGIMMGIGAALGEEFIREGGRIANTGFADYGCPRASDLPELKVVFLDSQDGPGRYGSRGIAEICLAPTSAAIANAIADAVGIRVRSLPITPDKIVNARKTGIATAKIRPIWTRPDRWWIALVRGLYPLGLLLVLDRWGTGWARGGSRGPGTLSLQQPTQLDDALAAIAAPGARVLGAGTDLMLTRRQGLSPGPATWVDVRANGQLGKILPNAGGLRLGATVTLAELADSELVPARSGLRETVLEIASRQVRSVATLAGNLCQEKRCWFFRHDFNCYKRAGPTAPCYAVEGDHRFYHAVMGAHRCQAVTPSDLAATFLALDAEIDLQSIRGTRRIPIGELYLGPGETSLRDDEILTEIIVPSESLARSTAFRKLSLSKGGFAVCAAAASLSLDERGRVEQLRVALGGLAPIPVRAAAVERALIGRVPAPAAIAAASAAWLEDAHPLRNNGWKLAAAETLVARAIEAALGAARQQAPEKTA